MNADVFQGDTDFNACLCSSIQISVLWDREQQRRHAVSLVTDKDTLYARLPWPLGYFSVFSFLAAVSSFPLCASQLRKNNHFPFPSMSRAK